MLHDAVFQCCVEKCLKIGCGICISFLIERYLNIDYFLTSRGNIAALRRSTYRSSPQSTLMADALLTCTADDIGDGMNKQNPDLLLCL